MLAAVESRVADAAALTARSLSRVRGKRIFHPDGIGYSAQLRPAAAPLEPSALARRTEAIVRISRALGLPEALPDLYGLALRVPDAYGPGRHQDLLLATSGNHRFSRYALLPSRGLLARTFSTVLPYRLDGKLIMLGARALGDAEPGPRLGEVAGADPVALEFELLAASPGGRWRRAATLSLRERLPDEEVEPLGFNPTNTGGGLELAGLLNRIRGPSYRASQRGRLSSSRPRAPARE